MRLDKYIVEKEKISREKSQELINNGSVVVNSILCKKIALDIKEQDTVKITKNIEFVSRGAYKLKHACEAFSFSVKNKVVLDIGASTGGFTDYCLKNGAQHVFAVDVGTDQLDKKIKNNKKVTSIEQTNIKNLLIEQISKEINFIVADVSFISLTHVIDKISELFHKKISAMLLIKPQFELSKIDLSKTKGLVTNEKNRQRAINKISDYAKSKGYVVKGITKSPILGKKMGNKEFIIFIE